MHHDGSDADFIDSHELQVLGISSSGEYSGTLADMYVHAPAAHFGTSRMLIISNALPCENVLRFSAVNATHGSMHALCVWLQVLCRRHIVRAHVRESAISRLNNGVWRAYISLG